MMAKIRLPTRPRAAGRREPTGRRCREGAGGRRPDVRRRHRMPHDLGRRWLSCYRMKPNLWPVDIRRPDATTPSSSDRMSSGSRRYTPKGSYDGQPDRTEVVCDVVATAPEPGANPTDQLLTNSPLKTGSAARNLRAENDLPARPDGADLRRRVWQAGSHEWRFR